MDLEFTLRSADVVEKQDGLDQKLGVRGYNPRVGQGQLGYIPRFLSPLGWVTLEFIGNFLGGLILIPKNVFWSLEHVGCPFATGVLLGLSRAPK